MPGLVHRILPVLACVAAFAPAVAHADSMYEVFTGNAYDLEFPDDPAAAAGDLNFRWVPLCEDGSGNHEWSRSAGLSGIAPTCPVEDYVRCIDGTRPMVYLDKARLADGSADTLSNSWVFWFQGGGSCSDRDTVGAGENCWDNYLDPGEADEMGSSDNLRRIAGGGILDPDRVENVFKTYNRVQIKKCTYDRFTGTSELLATPNGDGDDIDLYWHGRRVIAAVIADLADGAVYRDGGVDVVLPPLTNTFRALFSGHSGGSGGLIMNGDWLAAQILALRPAAKVRLLVDARFEPSLENEAAFDSAVTVANDDANGDGVIDMWDHIAPSVANPGTLPGGTAYHRGSWQATGGAAIQQDQWGVQFDASCEAALGAGDVRCRNESHVLMNHVSTPFFVRQALRDSNHVNHAVAYADDTAFRFTVPEYKERVLAQLDAFVEGHHSLSMAATGAAGIPVPTWPLGVFATDTSVHAGEHDDQQFFDELLCEVGVGTDPSDAFSYHDALFEWITFDTERVAVEDAGAFAGEYCDASDPACDCH